MFKKRITNAMHVQYPNLPKISFHPPDWQPKRFQPLEEVKMQLHHDKKYIISVLVLVLYIA